MISRALFVVGLQDSGKSAQLRSMFIDPRFGTDGQVPTTRNVKEIIQLGDDLRLYLRLTSPHESNESVEQWLSKIINRTLAGEWCVAGALQPLPDKKMPSAVQAVKAFLETFEHVRVRVVFLSPDRHTQCAHESFDVYDLTTQMRSLPKVESMSIDARDRKANGLLLTDFFDFQKPAVSKRQ